MWPFKKDSHAQFEQLLKPHLRKLYHLAYRFTGTQDDAEDLVQDLLLKLYPRLDEIQNIDNLFSWLSKVLYRQFIDNVRRQQRSPIHLMENEEAIYETHASEAAGPSEITNSVLTQDVLNGALNRLNDDQRVLVLLHDVEGYSLQEINEILDVPVGTLKSRLSRARTKLREVLHNMEPNQEIERVSEVTG